MLDWTPRDTPDLQGTKGRFVHVAPLRPESDAADLFAAIGGPHNDELWRYIPFGPFESVDPLIGVLGFMAKTQNWKSLVFRDASTREMLGMSSYMRVRPEAGSAEVGAVVFSPKLQRTPAATEAMFIMARHLFDEQGYRRYEWKCDNANAASKRAAERFGFSFEGVFRQDLVVKGRNRDTAWFSMIDGEWPVIRAAFEAWLAPENFDADGAQRASLASLRKA